MAGAVLTHLVFDIFQEAVALWLHRKERDTNDELMPVG